MNSNYSSLCTVFIVTYYSEDKIRHCLDSISNKYKIIIFDNSGQLDNKKKIEKSYPNVNYIVSKKILEYPGLTILD